MNEGKIRIDWSDLGAAHRQGENDTGTSGSRHSRPSESIAWEPMGEEAPARQSRTHPQTPQPASHHLPSTMRANARIAGQSCAICHSRIELGQEIRNCELCKLSFHLECWETNYGCATYGCGNGPDAREQLPSPTIKIDAFSGQQIQRCTTMTPAPVGVSYPRPDGGNLQACVRCGQFFLSSELQCRFCGYRSGIPVQYAGVWKRFCAAFVDSIVLAIPQLLCEAVLPVVGGIMLYWIYSATMESSTRQATLGKMALGIRVCDLQGRRLTFGRATGRHFAKFLSFLSVCIGYIMAAFTEKKQALHDLVAGCLVVRKL